MPFQMASLVLTQSDLEMTYPGMVPAIAMATGTSSSN